MLLLALYITSFFVLFPFNLTIYKNQEKTTNPIEKKVLAGEIVFNELPTLTPTPFPTVTPTSVSTIAPSNEWGVSKQIEGVTYTIKVQDDNQTATAQEILDALNNYRKTHGVGVLSWDNNLANFAQSRADKFNSEQKLDNHAGFNELFKNPDNAKNIGFLRLGENSSLGFTLSGVHLIEWVYASDAPHNNNQLNSSWTHVGIGVSGNATDLVFGGNKL